MPATLYLRPQPRAFFLITETHALIFRQPSSSETKAARSVVVAEFLPIEEVDVRGLVRASKGRTVEGVLGVTSVPTDRSPVPEIFLLLASHATPLSPLLPSSSLRPSRIVSVEFHSLSSAFWDPPDLSSTASNSLTLDYDSDDLHGSPSGSGYSTPQASYQSQAQAQGVEHPCSGMKKILESRSFFFAEGCKWDITTRMGQSNFIQAEKQSNSAPSSRYSTTPMPPAHPLETFDERFMWNASILAPFLAFRSGLPDETRRALDDQSLLIPIIQGFCGSVPISTGEWASSGRPEIASLSIISRLSWKRAGARFRTRGIDDDGQVANFVETEVLLALDSVCLSYVQVRGSVPLFWQQPSQGIQTLQQKVEITRPAQATQPAFDKHFLELMEHYHSVHAVNLLGQKDAEAMLSAAYADHLHQLQYSLEQSPPALEKNGGQVSPRGMVNLTPYDFHAVVRASGDEAVKYDFSTGLKEVVPAAENFGWTAVDTASGEVIEEQQGVFRTNCLDCLDRTNFVQNTISQIALSRFLYSIDSMLATSPSLWQAHRELWADNGDRLSKIYAGTGAINTSATRTGKKTFAGLLSDATKSVSRAYINNFQDKGKQEAIDLLLGMMAGQRPIILFDPISDSVQTALQARMNEYSSVRNVSIFVGTWNLNGKAPSEALDSWLFPSNSPDADIYMIAFQEIVELVPQQILQTDPAKRRRWETYIMEHFNRKRKNEYLLFRSEQLVGAALIIVVKASLTKSIRSIESSTRKTGLSGLSGNKGGVGIRLNLFDSTICFMTAHFAAGHSNVTERNADYKTISQGLKFLRGKTIDDHDVVIWAADFNYRIALPGPEVREYAETDQLDPLLASDQLSQAMDAGEVFMGYDEGPITFRPTYKYDNDSDEYDTSEKARIPAWTDRILFKGSALRQTAYHRADLRTSDHRPVYAIFDATVREVDAARKDAVTKSITATIRKRGPTDNTIDEKIERGLGNGITGLVKEMTNAEITPVLVPKPYSARVKPPALPSRSTPTTGGDDKPALITRKSQGISTSRAGPPPLPRRGSPAPAILSSSPSSSSPTHDYPPAQTTRRPPPPPERLRKGTGTGAPTTAARGSGSTFQPSESTIAAIAARRLAQPTVNASSSLSRTSAPSSTLDLDMDAAPPTGLIEPVMPDLKKSPKQGVLASPPAKPPIPLSTKPSAKSFKATAIDRGEETSPPMPKPNPVLSPKPTLPRAVAAATEEAGPAPPKNGAGSGSVADRLKQWEQLNAKVAQAPSKPQPLRKLTLEGGGGKKGDTPPVPGKPVRLRSSSSVNAPGAL